MNSPEETMHRFSNLLNASLAAIVLLSAPIAAHAGYAVISFDASADDYIYETSTSTGISKSFSTPGNPGDIANGYYDLGDVSNPVRGNHAGVSGSIHINPIPTISLQGYAVSAANGPHHFPYEERLRADFSGAGSIQYDWNVTGPGGYVPIFITGMASGHKTSGPGFDGEIKAQLDFQNVVGNGIFDTLGDAETSKYARFNASTGTWNYHANFGNQRFLNTADDFSTAFRYEIFVKSNTSFSLLMNASVTGSALEGATQGSVYLDPYLFIDPDWQASHPGYRLQTEAGFGNSAPVPEPAAAWLMGFGMCLLPWARRRQRRH